MFVEVLGNVPEGQVVIQFDPDKYLTPEQLRQLLFDDPLQVSHSPWQESQVFVVEFSNTFVATQAIGQLVPSRYLPFGQEVHWLFAAPVHSEHSPSQTSQVFVPVFLYFPEGQVSLHSLPSKNLAPEQLRHWVLAGPLHVSHSPWQASQLFVVEFSKTFVATHAVGQLFPSRYLPFGHEVH